MHAPATAQVAAGKLQQRLLPPLIIPIPVALAQYNLHAGGGENEEPWNNQGVIKTDRARQ